MTLKELEIKPFSKKGYKSFRFEDIAFSISERVEPKQTDLEIYVGLEHIDADSIHIKRHGTPADVEGTKLKVYPGDLIFGKRRAYQRKAAISNFEGICSAHAMVLRANPKVIIPELFPFFIHSDQFMNRAIDISVGSLSPTINWGTLKTQEFVLPPKEQQVKLAELLWTADKTISGYSNIDAKLGLNKRIILSYFFNNHKKNKKLGEICLPKQWPTIQQTEFTDDGYLVYGANGVIGKYKSYNHEHPTIAITCRGATCGNVHLTSNKVYITGNAMSLDNVDLDMVDLNYLYYQLDFLSLKSIISGSAQPQIIQSELKDFKVYIPNKKDQSNLVSKIERINNSIMNNKIQMEKMEQIQKQLINQIF